MNPLHILVADDDVQNQRMLSLILKRKGHSLDFASTGVEVVDAVDKNKFDLVLMDVLMPYMDGIEATRQIRASENGNGRLPIIGLTAVIEVEFTRCLQAGMDHVLSKPLDVEELEEVINGSLNGTNASNKQSSTTKKTFNSVVLDIESAVRRMGDDHEVYREVLGEFINSFQTKYAELANDFNSKEWEQLSVHAHNLKGLSASIGAMELSGIAMELDELSNESEHQLVSQKLNEKLNEIEVGMNKLKKIALVYLNGKHNEMGNTAI